MLSNHVRRLFPVTLGLIALLALVGTTPQSVAAEAKQTPVSGQFFQTEYTANCTSPIGLCGEGPITGNILNGNLVGIINTLTFLNSREFEFSATVTISTAKGDLYGKAVLVQMATSETISSGTITLTGGTKRYNHSTGVLHLTEPAPDVNGVQHYYYTGWLSK